ncbi:MAG: VCBS repeat-containing protein [Geminicoccaceae bacterium]
MQPADSAADESCPLSPARLGRHPGQGPWRLGLVATVAGIITCVLALSAQAQVRDPVARDIAAEVGLNFHGAALAKTQGETPIFDYDGDGDSDILLSTHGGSPWPLMQNQGNGTFKEVLNGTFFTTDRHGCVDADFGSLSGNGRPDGLPDLYCVTGACKGTCKKEYPNSLFIQRPDHTFAEVGRSWGVADPHGRGRKPLAFDFNNDGLPDIVVANEGPSIYPPLNRLYKNVGGRFEEVTNSPVETYLGSECAVSGYVDSDKWRDLMFCSKATGTGVVTYKNVNGVFSNITTSTAYKNRKALSLQLADVNNDNKQDLLILEKTKFSVWINVNGAYPKANFTYAIGGGTDTAVGDVNNDKKLDIFITQGPNSKYKHVMLINNGDGKSYHTIPLPVLTQGYGDTVTNFKNWNGTGRSAFLVTNGLWGVAGPVQLITFADQ